MIAHRPILVILAAYAVGELRLLPSSRAIWGPRLRTARAPRAERPERPSPAGGIGLPAERLCGDGHRSVSIMFVSRYRSSQLAFGRSQDCLAASVSTFIQRYGGKLLTAGISQPRDYLLCGHLPVALPRLLDVYGSSGAFLGTGFGERLREPRLF